MYSSSYTLFYTEWGADAALGYWGALLGTGATIIAVIIAIRISNDEAKSASEAAESASERHSQLVKLQIQLNQARDEHSLLVKLTQEYLSLLALSNDKDFYAVDDIDTATFKRLLSHPHRVNVSLRNFRLLFFDKRDNFPEEDKKFIQCLENIRTDYLVIYNEFIALVEKARMIQKAIKTNDFSEINSIKINEFMADVMKNPNAEKRPDSFNEKTIRQMADEANTKVFKFSNERYSEFILEVGAYLKHRKDIISQLVVESEKV